MTYLLFLDIQTIFSAILIQLIEIIPVVFGIYLIFYFLRTLLFKD